MWRNEHEYNGSQKSGKEIKTYNYAYGDSNWKDKLTSFDGKEITYDQIGNPLTYDGYNFTWEHGRRLKSIKGNNKNISYKYNDSGIRTEKNVNGEVTRYHLNGSDVAYEETLDSTGKVKDSIYYNYDSSNHLVSMTLNGEEYFYIRNDQNDTIALTDKSGQQVVTYSYDTWGKLITIEGSLKDSVGVRNPYRYRGYRYDIETGLYYLNARYYNPGWGRFINADAIAGTVGEVLGHNVFIYCKNDPINMSDETGFRPKFNNPFQRETPEMERVSIDVYSKWRKNSWYPKARSKRKSNSKISKYVKKPTKYIVGRTFKFIKDNKVTIGTSIVGGVIGAAKGVAKKTIFHNSKKLIRIDKMKNMFKYGTATSASFGGFKSGIVDFLFDTEEWFDETRIGKDINEQLDYTEQRIYIFIGD